MGSPHQLQVAVAMLCADLAVPPPPASPRAHFVMHSGSDIYHKHHVPAMGMPLLLAHSRTTAGLSQQPGPAC
jgi:hypothetical protein